MNVPDEKSYQSIKKKIVYFVRHGQSEHNAAPVFQSPDSPLNEKGREQAGYLAARVSKLNFEKLISSPFERAKQTAQAITKTTSKNPEFSDLFVERIKPTFINGKPYADEKAGELWRKWEKSLFTPGMRVEDGENFEDILSRAGRALDFLKNRSEQSILVVTHGYFLRMILARVLIGNFLTGEIFKNFQSSASMENTGITAIRYYARFEEEASWKLWIYNDHAHLG